jgi:EAL domain-containing protein (putative c-di-GMP-specific phosphodiesterase class I)
VAERFGTILALDSWVVRQAIGPIAEQERAGRAITLHGNVAGKLIGNGQRRSSSLIGRWLRPAPIPRAWCLS